MKKRGDFVILVLILMKRTHGSVFSTNTICPINIFLMLSDNKNDDEDHNDKRNNSNNNKNNSNKETIIIIL